MNIVIIKNESVVQTCCTAVINSKRIEKVIELEVS